MKLDVISAKLPKMDESVDNRSKNITKQSVENSDLDDENSKECNLSAGSRICLVGSAGSDVDAEKAAWEFGIDVVKSEDGSEWKGCKSTLFVFDVFEGPEFECFKDLKLRILGVTALKELASRNETLPPPHRPLYSLAMQGLSICFTGFRQTEEVSHLVKMVHNMGGRVRQDVDSRMTHLVAQRSGGAKYQYAMTFRLPIVGASWVREAWAMRPQCHYMASDTNVVNQHKLKPFQGLRVCFLGFPSEEQSHMAEVLVQNGGTHTDPKDKHCSHMVLDSAVTYDLVKTGTRAPLKSPLPSTSTPCDNHMDCTDVSPDHPFHKELMQTKSEIIKNTSEKVGKRLSLTSLASPSLLNSPLANRRNKLSLAPISESPNKGVSVKKELSFSDNDDCASPKMDAKRRKTMSPTELNRTRKFKKSPKDSFKMFAHSSLRKSFKMKTHSLARWISSSDVCTTASPGIPKIAESTSTTPIPPTKPVASTPACSTGEEESHGMPMVVDESTVTTVPSHVSQKAYILKAEWFWASVQIEGCIDEKDYLFEDYLESLLSPSRRSTPLPVHHTRKRRRLQEAVARLTTSPVAHNRRSSVSDAGLLSVSGSFLDCTTSPTTHIPDSDAESVVVEAQLDLKDLSARHKIFLEMVQTEFNYVNTLKTIITLYKKPLEDMCETENQLLNPTQLKIIFGHLPPIYQTHCKMLEELGKAAKQWTEDISVGSIILKFSTDLVNGYPPYINFLEHTKEMLHQCDQSMPKFHAFLKIGQTKPECGRQSLFDLLTWPVQRLPRIELLLSDILKCTNQKNPDYDALMSALASIRNVNKYINEDKRRTEAQMEIFNIHNDIENCPAHLVSSHRSFITRCDVTELNGGLSRRGDALSFFLFSDVVEVCKKRTKAFNSLKSPNTTKLSNARPYKHIRLMPLSHIRRVIDITETEECHNVFALCCKNSQELKDKLYSFTITDEGTDEMTFLRTLCRQMANTVCRPDAENFLACFDPDQLNIDTSDIGLGTLGKAMKLASKTRIGRALSFNKTPSKLKRAMSTMMSPFGSTSNLTPASQFEQMKLASCANLNELGNSTPPVASHYPAPMSVQPTRRNKHASLSVASLRRL